MGAFLFSIRKLSKFAVRADSLKAQFTLALCTILALADCGSINSEAFKIQFPDASSCLFPRFNLKPLQSGAIKRDLF